LIQLGAMWLGSRIRRRLPQHHLSSDTKDTVKVAMGLVTTMTALILGLLVSSAKTTYDTARSEVMQMATKVAYVDRMLALYGPEAADTRRQLRDALVAAMRRMWPEEHDVPAKLEPDTQTGDALFTAMHELTPRTDLQRDIKAQCVTILAEVGQLRTLLQVQSAQSISPALLVAVEGWLVMIFLASSVVAPPTYTATIAMVAAAISVSGALFLILELDQPFGGLIGIASEPMTLALSHLAH
jgi:uncharacterized protein with PQ loop repeat